MSTEERENVTAWRVAWLERDYDRPGRFVAPPDHPAMNARGIFQIKDDHEVRCGGWDGCGNERESLAKTIKWFAEVAR